MRPIGGAMLAAGLLLGAGLPGAAAPALPDARPAPAPLAIKPPADPVTPREFYNLGTEFLRHGDLAKAEQVLTDLLEKQVERFQNPALYNLGHIRFQQGIKELAKGPKAKAAAAQGQAAFDQAGAAIAGADAALAGTDIDHLVKAYMQGRGARKELKAARQAVKRAIEVLGNTLRRWERASGDFKSALELQASDADSRHNAEVVDRAIAKLVDSLREMQQMANAMSNQKDKLGEKMKQMKGRIPEPDMPPGAAGDDEEEEDTPDGPKPDQQEGTSTEGQEMQLSPEQAAALLDSYKLGDRRLPMGQLEPGDPKRRPTEEY